MNGLTSIVIPSRNEPYLTKTIQDILKKATGNIEVIVTLDGYWPASSDIIEDDRVTYLHYTKAKGMRNAINSAVAISRGEYLLKTDAHCLFNKGFDEVLKKDCLDNWVVVPRRYALDPVRWEIIDNPKYPIDYMFLSKDLHGEVWHEKNRDPKLININIDDTMSAQGSAWFMKRTYFDYLELLDEEKYGNFYNEFQEIGLKAWLSGGRVVVNKKTFYAHWHKDKQSGRGYALDEGSKTNYVNQWLGKEHIWQKQKYDLSWLIEKFKPVPTWNI